MKKYVKNGKISSLPSSGLANALIPIPSLEEQERIATILDKFYALTTDITAGLPAEIEARRKQYEYYRDKLLTFKQK
jgi:type I restriction enzyme S subunit